MKTSSIHGLIRRNRGRRKALPLLAAIALFLALASQAQTIPANDATNGTVLQNVHAEYANENGPVHGWIALQAYLLLPAGQLKQELSSYLPTDPTNSCYAQSFTSLPGWGISLDQVDPNSSGTALIEGAWEEDGPLRNVLRSFDHFWNPDQGFNAGLPLYVSALTVANLYFKNAVDAHKTGDFVRSYYWLGRVAHLLADMSVPAHVHLDPHPTDAYEAFTKQSYMRVTSTSPGVSIPDPTLMSCYCNTPAGFDTDLANLFFHQANSAQQFDSDDVSGKGADYGRGKYRSGWNRLAGGKTLSRAELWAGDLLGPPAFERNLNRLSDYDVFKDCDAPQDSRICYYESFYAEYSGTTKHLKVFYTDGSSEFLAPMIDEIWNIPEPILKCIVQPKLEAEAISHVAALYQLFWHRVQSAPPAVPTINLRVHKFKNEINTNGKTSITIVGGQQAYISWNNIPAGYSCTKNMVYPLGTFPGWRGTVSSSQNLSIPLGVLNGGVYQFQIECTKTGSQKITSNLVTITAITSGGGGG